jgi:alkanesulfonate monooxygenase
MINFYWEFPHSTFEHKHSMDETYAFLKTLDDHSIKGSLIYYHHQSLDPWIIATSILQHTTRHVPLVAMQPYTMLPSTAATMIHSISHIYQRKVNINLISGFFMKDLKEISSTLDKQERYARLMEFAEILRMMFASNDPLTFAGTYYNYENFSHSCALPEPMRPEFFMPMTSGSPEGLEAILKTADVAVTIPKCLSHFAANFVDKLKSGSLRKSVKLQILARPTFDEAYAHVQETDISFKERQVAKRMESKAWEPTEEEQYMYYPAVNVAGPLIIGSYDQVTAYLAKYIDLGVTDFIIPNIRQHELHHCDLVFRNFM